jgi:Tfp pilus assembly protein PilF
VSRTQETLTRAAERLQAGDLERAEECCRKVLRVEPSAAEAWYLLGAVKQLGNQCAESVGEYLRALSLDPRHVGARTNLGLALLALGKVAPAKVHLREAIRLDPAFAQAYNNLGTAHQTEGELEQAAACFRRVLELRPGSLEAIDNLGGTLHAMGELEQAVECYETALAIDPDRSESNFYRGLTWLTMGELKRGWEGYQRRFDCKGYPILEFRQPLWDGTPLDGRGILLYADQGLGDSIQFVRYSSLIHEKGGHAVVVCQKSLERILMSCPHVEAAVTEGAVVPDLDVYLPISSLPAIFETSLATIPNDVPYLFADPRLVKSWGAELGSYQGFKIGVCWQGNPAHAKDRDRSFPLARLEPVAQVKGVRLFSLQTGRGAEQLGEVGGRFAITDLGGRLGDLMDTAAVMKNLDLMITPDTALAHLAGALGVPAWVALPFAPDWRWLLEREYSPWYPSIRLFRQQRWGDWDGVFQCMAGELKKGSGTFSCRNGS